MKKEEYYKLEKQMLSRNDTTLFLINRFKKYWYLIIPSLISIIIATSASTFIPVLIKRITDSALIDADTVLLSKNIETAVILLVISFIFSAVQNRLIGYLGQKVLYDLRSEIFKKIQQLPMKFFVYNNSGDIITRVTEDVENINYMLSAGLIRSINVFFTVIITIIIMSSIDLNLTLISLSPLPIVLLFLAIQGKVLQKLIKRTLDLRSSVANIIQDTLNSFALIKAFNKGAYINKVFEGRNNDYFKSAKKVAKFTAFARAMTAFLVKVGIGIVLLICLRMLADNLITIGTLLSFAIYIIQLFNPITRLAMLSSIIRKGLASAQRIGSILKLETDIEEVENPYIPEDRSVKGEVEFENVTFSYEKNKPVLKNIDFNIKANETVAIVGPTGGGKTTFVNLIARLYDTDSGKVLVDGIEVKKWDLKFLRSKIGYLLQETFLFEDTIFNNLKYGKKNLKKNEANELLDKLGFWEMIKDRKITLDTFIKTGSRNLSTGQKQILAIARILLSNPEILILDEATASIDTKSEQAVQRAIEFAAKDLTTIIIAHRINTVENADRIIVIKNNKILESGTKEELLSKKGEFYEMWKEFKGE